MTAGENGHGTGVAEMPAFDEAIGPEIPFDPSFLDISTD